MFVYRHTKILYVHVPGTVCQHLCMFYPASLIVRKLSYYPHARAAFLLVLLACFLFVPSQHHKNQER